MAAIAIPIITAVAPTLIPLLVQEAEKIFGPKTGPTKNAVVTNAASTVLNAAATAGKLGGPAPPVDQISALVSQIAGQLFPTGTTVTPTPPNSQPTIGSNTTVPPSPTSAPISIDLKKAVREIIVWALSN
jgi:hypothetical protein